MVAPGGDRASAYRASPAPAHGRDTNSGPVDDKREAALGSALKGLVWGQKKGPRQPGKAATIPYAQLLHLAHRLLIIGVAVGYLVTSVESCVASIKVLNGVRNEPMRFEAYETKNILQWVGKSTIRSSPFVMQVLENNTTPRNYTAYLEANGVVSVTGCSTPLFNKRLYSNSFLRLALMGLQRDCTYNITELITYQVVVPLVDCSYTPLVRGSDTDVRMFFLMRRHTDPDDMMIVSTRFSMQDYKVLEMNEYGPFGLAHHQFIKDMSQPKIFKNAFSGALGYPFEPATSFAYTNPTLNEKGWWVTTAIPPNAATAPKEVITSSRTGFYIHNDDEQSNIKNQYWTIDEDPVTALTKWNWKGEPLLKDSWAWVHLLHAWFALDALGSLSLLFLVMFRNFQRGRFWIGDAFVSMSSSLMVRGAAILITWRINEFWALMEFCLHDAHHLANTQEIYFHPSIMRADLLTLFLAACNVIGNVFRERIDPVFAIILFQIAFDARLSIAKMFPKVMETITTYAEEDLEKSVLGVSQTVAMSSPLRLWTTHELPARELNFILACMMPLFNALIVVVVYVLAMKVYHRVHRDKIYKQDSKNTTGTHVSESDEATMTLYKRNLTLFEIATGAELQARYGVISDFENYLFIKGMKYASADGVYSNGFVIANGKFLIASDDWIPILLQKLLRIRLRNFYAYQVEGNTVQQRARLVYPETLSWEDLTHLNIAVLS